MYVGIRRQEIFPEFNSLVQQFGFGMLAFTFPVKFVNSHNYSVTQSFWSFWMNINSTDTHSYLNYVLNIIENTASVAGFYILIFLSTQY